MLLKKRRMQKGGRQWRRHIGSIITLIFVSFFFASCTAYSPAYYPSYDILNPGTEVRANPFGFVVFDAELEHYVIIWDADAILKSDEEYTIVNMAFLLHYRELWDEVIKLRKEK